MNSGAGHDCMNLAPSFPRADICSQQGYSHNKNEFTDFGDIQAGIEMERAVKVLPA